MIKMRIKKLVTAVTAGFVMIIVLAHPVFAGMMYEPDFPVECASAYLYNLDLKVPVYAKEEGARLDPASLTKIMTAIIVMETIPADQLDTLMVTCDEDIMNNPYWNEQQASMSQLVAGEQVSVKNLLYALIIQSSCEVGDVLGRYVAANYFDGGDIQTFVGKMNEKAAALGCENTNFMNTHGLEAENQYSSARDMALIAGHALTLSGFADMANTDSFGIKPTNTNPENHWFNNTNMMIYSQNEWYYKPLRSVKTGTTNVNTQNLITTAHQNGYNYLLVVMGGKQFDDEDNALHTTYKDTKNLYEWAFGKFAVQTVLTARDSAAGDEIPVRLSTTREFVIAVPENGLDLLLPNDVKAEDVKRVPRTPETIDAPIEANQVLGTMDLMTGDTVLASVNLVANESIERSSFLYIMDRIWKFLTLPIVKGSLAIAAVLIVGYVILAVRHIRKAKKKLMNSDHVKIGKNK